MPALTASAACCNDAVGLAPPMCTVVASRRSSMPRLAASSSLLVYPGGGMMPSMSATERPASAIAVVAASSMSLHRQPIRAAHVLGLTDADDGRAIREAVHERRMLRERSKAAAGVPVSA